MWPKSIQLVPARHFSFRVDGHKSCCFKECHISTEKESSSVAVAFSGQQPAISTKQIYHNDDRYSFCFHYKSDKGKFIYSFWYQSPPQVSTKRTASCLQHWEYSRVIDTQRWWPLPALGSDVFICHLFISNYLGKSPTEMTTMYRHRSLACQDWHLYTSRLVFPDAVSDSNSFHFQQVRKSSTNDERPPPPPDCNLGERVSQQGQDSTRLPQLSASRPKNIYHRPIAQRNWTKQNCLPIHPETKLSRMSAIMRSSAITEIAICEIWETKNWSNAVKACALLTRTSFLTQQLTFTLTTITQLTARDCISGSHFKQRDLSTMQIKFSCQNNKGQITQLCIFPLLQKCFVLILVRR